jgi:TatD DNase family protein
MIDTHTHLYLDDYLPDKCAAVDRALVAGVEMMILPGVDAGSIPQVRELHSLRPEVTAMCAGLHPTEVKEDRADHLSAIEQELTTHAADYVAVGEVGLDLYWEQDKLPWQLEVLEAQLDMADRLNLPIIVHCRSALPQMLDVVRGRRGHLPQMVFHCFGGTDKDVDAIRREVEQPLFGIGGVVTFKKSTLPEVLPRIGINHIVLETDAPWLAPVPHRGSTNESAFLPHIAERIALELKLTPEQVDSATTHNARQCFRLS